MKYITAAWKFQHK